jgi:hypothetical protein
MKYCFNCSQALAGNENFCPQCGQELKNSDRNPPLNSSEMLSFSSRFLLGGNVIRPDKLIVTDKNVVYEKRNKNLIGIDKTILPISQIASVEIDRKLISSNILIYSKGKQIVTVENFTIGDAKKIKEAIESRF